MSVTPPTKAELFWNTLGSTMYAISTVVLSYFTIYVCGGEDGGVVSIALTSAQLFAFITYFETRNYQNSGTGEAFSFAAYRFLKRILFPVNLVVAVLFILFRGYDTGKAVCVFCFCLYRALDGYADLYESQFQHEGKLAYAGMSQFWRSFLSIVLYVICVLITRDVWLSSIALSVFSLGTVFVLAVLFRRLHSAEASVDGVNTGNENAGFPQDAAVKDATENAGVKTLALECLPLAASMMLWAYILSASRMAVDSHMTNEAVAVYQVMFLPVSFMNLLVTFVYRPLLPSLAGMNRENKKSMYRFVLRSVLAVFGVTVLIAALGYLAGPFALRLISGLDVRTERGVLALLLLGGGANAAATVIYYLLVIQRKQKQVLTGYAIASVVAFGAAEWMTSRLGLTGAALGFLAAVTVLFAVFCVCLFLFDQYFDESLDGSMPGSK